MKGLLLWLLRLLGRKAKGIEPHPELTTDQGQRRHIENLMERESRHAGKKQ